MAVRARLAERHFPNAKLRAVGGVCGGTKRGLPSDFPNAQLRVVGGD